MSTKLPPGTLHAARLVNEFAVAGITLVLADFLQTFPTEVGLIWPARMNAGKALFLLVRYLALALAVLMYLSGLSLTLSDWNCKILFTATGILKFALPLLGEIIVYMRVWAFSGCDRRVLYYLVAQYIVMFSSATYLLAKFIISAKVSSGRPLTGFSCIFSSGDSISVTIIYAMFLASGIVLMAFMIIVGIYRYNGPLEARRRNGLFVQFYRDGTIYFLVLVVLTSANIASVLTARAAALVEFQPYIHSIVSTRMILHLHEYSGRTEDISCQSIYAESNTGNQGLVGIGPMGMLKAVIPKFTPARRADGIETRTATTRIRFASLDVTTCSDPLP